VGRGRLGRIAAVAANTYRETVRARVFYNLLIFAVLMTLSGLLLARLSIRQQDKILKDLGLACMEWFGTAIAIFMGVGLVSKELERRSLYPLLAKPLGRDEFYLGKFLGLGTTLLVNVSVMTLGLMVTLWLTGSQPGLSLLKAAYPIYLGLLLTVSLALLLSTLSSSPIAALVTLCLVVAGRFSDVIRNMQEVAPGMPTWFVQALYWALPNFLNFDFKDAVTYGDPVPLAALGWVTGYAAVYVGVVLAAGMTLFKSRELV